MWGGRIIDAYRLQSTQSMDAMRQQKRGRGGLDRAKRKWIQYCIFGFGYGYGEAVEEKALSAQVCWMLCSHFLALHFIFMENVCRNIMLPIAN